MTDTTTHTAAADLPAPKPEPAPQPRRPVKTETYPLRDVKVGDVVTTFAVLSQWDGRKTTKSGDLMGSGTVRDLSGAFPVVWFPSPMQYAALTGVCAGQVVKIRAKRDAYAGGENFKVEQMRGATDDEISQVRHVLVPTSPTLDDDLAFIRQVIAEWDSPLAALCNAFWGEGTPDDVHTAPCSDGFNHAYIGGLAKMVVEMLTIAKPVLSLYPELNKDWVQAGILLANVGKAQCFSVFPGIAETDAQNKEGHIASGLLMVAQAVRENPIGESDWCALKHIILSQSGRVEWGSPVSPKTPEAAAVHCIESMATKVSGLIYKASIEAA